MEACCVGQVSSMVSSAERRVDRMAWVAGQIERRGGVHIERGGEARERHASRPGSLSLKMLILKSSVVTLSHSHRLSGEGHKRQGLAAPCRGRTGRNRTRRSGSRDGKLRRGVVPQSSIRFMCTYAPPLTTKSPVTLAHRPGKKCLCGVLVFPDRPGEPEFIRRDDAVALGSTSKYERRSSM